jgi:hypothetical protein
MSDTLALLNSLGLSAEEIERKIIQQCTDDLMRQYYTHEDGESAGHGKSTIVEKLEEKMAERIDAALEKVVSERFSAQLPQLLADFIFTPTSRYGEKKGKPRTFLEYVTDHAKEWAEQRVNDQGSVVGKDQYSYSNHKTRFQRLLDEKVSADVNAALAQILKDGHSILITGLADELKRRMTEMAESLARRGR